MFIFFLLSELLDVLDNVYGHLGLLLADQAHRNDWNKGHLCCDGYLTGQEKIENSIRRHRMVVR